MRASVDPFPVPARNVPRSPRHVSELDTFHYGLRYPRSDLYEWKFTRAGWVFVAGVLRRPTDSAETTVALARRMLATWRWVDPSDR